MPSWRALLTVFLISTAPNLVRSPAKIQSKTESSENRVAEIVKGSVEAVVLIETFDAAGVGIRQGSGFIVSTDGKIITNYHVIKDVTTARVELANGAFFPMDAVLGVDLERDLAMIKVSGKHLPTLSLADSGKAAVGERVVAIGSPLGLQNTVSDGIISALREQNPKVGWIQTTAPVSPGNSGGPLIQMDGSVVGVITWGVKIGQNLNFAAPSNEVAELLSHPSTAVSPAATTESSATPVNTDEIWTSMSSGRDYKLRFDGPYIYADMVFPPGLEGTTLAFVRSEVKKDGARWTGKIKSFLPCQYQNVWTKQMETKWFSEEVAVELTSVTPTRIEGRNQVYSGGYDCKKGLFKGPIDWKSFTLIPKDPGPSAAVRETVAKNPPEANGTIFLTSNPSEAETYVDDSFVAKTPTTLTLKPGHHYIRIFMNGYKNWSQQVTVAAGSEVALTAALEKSN